MHWIQPWHVTSGIGNHRIPRNHGVAGLHGNKALVYIAPIAWYEPHLGTQGMVGGPASLQQG